MFVFFSSRPGCLGSPGISIVLTLVLLSPLRVARGTDPRRSGAEAE